MSKTNYDAAREHADELLQQLMQEIDKNGLCYYDLFGIRPDNQSYETLIEMLIKSFSYYDRSVLP